MPPRHVVVEPPFLFKNMSKNVDWAPDLTSETILGRNSFALFGLPVQLEIDEDILEERYLKWTQKAHPDRNIDHQEWAILLTSRINQAYVELTNFRLRAELFLKIKTGSEHPSENRKALPKGFLKEVFKWNELQEDGSLSIDEVEDRYDNCLDDLIALSKQEPLDEKRFTEQMNSLKYLENLITAEEK